MKHRFSGRPGKPAAGRPLKRFLARQKTHRIWQLTSRSFDAGLLIVFKSE